MLHFDVNDNSRNHGLICTHFSIQGWNMKNQKGKRDRERERERAR